MLTNKVIIMLLTSLLLGSHLRAQGEEQEPTNYATEPNLDIARVRVKYLPKQEMMIFRIRTVGQAGLTVLRPFGQLDGAPVLGYVIPTTLKPTDVGFHGVEGILVLSVTSHPGFDDTPLWDENTDRDYANDGVIWHPHWVVPRADDRVPGAFSVRQFSGCGEGKLPPTNPGMPMYMDSPGFPVVTQGRDILVSVPAYQINNRQTFNYDAVSCYMQVNTSRKNLPMLGVYTVYDVASGDLSLPYSVR